MVVCVSLRVVREAEGGGVAVGELGLSTAEFQRDINGMTRAFVMSFI